MWKPKWLLALALPLAMAATAAPGTARASTVRDEAGMFSAAAVQKAEAELNRIEREFQVPVMIETIPSLDGEEIADVSPRTRPSSREQPGDLHPDRKERAKALRPRFAVLQPCDQRRPAKSDPRGVRRRLQER